MKTKTGMLYKSSRYADMLWCYLVLMDKTDMKSRSVTELK